MLHSYRISAIIIFYQQARSKKQCIFIKHLIRGCWPSHPPFCLLQFLTQRPFGWKARNSRHKLTVQKAGPLILWQHRLEARKGRINMCSRWFFTKAVTHAHKDVLHWRLASGVARCVSTRGAPAEALKHGWWPRWKGKDECHSGLI